VRNAADVVLRSAAVKMPDVRLKIEIAGLQCLSNPVAIRFGIEVAA
jgi:hypothetical protein